MGSSHSCTAVNDMYGGRSQFAGLLAAGLLAVFLLCFTHILKNVPLVALAAIIIAAGIRLFNLREVIRILRTRPASACQRGHDLGSPYHRSHDRDIDIGGFRHYPGAAPTGPPA